MRVLIAEDSRDMNRLIVRALTKSGYNVDSCFDGEDARLHLLGAEYDIIILDIMMPKVDGLNLLKQLRDEGNDTSVLLLTARDSIADRVKGLDLGADDYLIKPFDFDELLARIRAVTRKRAGNRTNLFKLADLEVNLEQHTVTRGGVAIQLFPKEFSVLEYMIRNKGVVLTREQLENRIWNYDYSGSSNNIDVYISRLRKKIDGGRDVKLVHTVRGVGYVLREEKE